MAARSSASISKVADRIERVACASAAKSRVISVSPRDVSDTWASEAKMLAARLECLIDAAAENAAQLDHSQVRERSATKASLQLQERLRLGARMLQAFQSQLSRAESVLHDLKKAEEGLRQISTDAAARLTADAERILNERMERIVCSIQTAAQPQSGLASEPRRLSFRNLADRNWAEPA